MFVIICILISTACASGFGNPILNHKLNAVGIVNANYVQVQHMPTKIRDNLSSGSFFSLQASTASTTEVKEEKSLLSSSVQRSIKFLLFAAILIRSFTLEKLINYSTLGQCLVLSTLATSCALRRIEDCYSYGYGGSLLLIGLLNGADVLKSFYTVAGNGVLNWSSFGNPLSIIKTLSKQELTTQIILAGCLLQSFAYILYGIRMLTFIFKRNNSASYLNSDRSQRMTEMDKKVAMSKRIFIWLSTAILLGGFYTLPLHLHCASVIQSLSTNVNTSSIIASIISCLTGIMSVSAVAFQYAADHQKHEHKEKWYQQQKKGDTSSSTLTTPFCTTGLYSIWRHPNYVSEFLFHVSIFLASLPAMFKCSSASIKSVTKASSTSVTTFPAIYKTLSSIVSTVSWKTVLLCSPGPLIFGSIIIAATRSLEKRQNEEYGSESSSFAEKYKLWVASTRRFL